MKLLDTLNIFFSKLDKKTFYTYTIVYSVTCGLLIVVMIYYYYSTTGELHKKIRGLNSSREEVLEILEKNVLIKQQQTIVEEMLAKDPNFKIQGTFGKIVANRNLLKKQQGGGEISTTDLEDNYRRNELSVKFDDMTMQELTQLLEDIEKNPRIATEKLDISRSKKNAKTIEVSLTISTLLPKVET
jgi:hypothetical protein